MRWSNVQVNGGRICVDCGGDIVDGSRAVAVYDDTRRDGSMIHADYYHKTCTKVARSPFQIKRA